MIIRFLRRAAAALLVAAAAHAQMPTVPGERALAPAPGPAPQLRVAPHQPKALTFLPAVSAGELAAVRAANRANATKGLARQVVVGITRSAFPVPSQLAWTRVPGGHAAQVAVTSPDAGSLRLALDLKGVPEDVEMVFFGSAQPSRLEGPVKVGAVRDRTGPWWSPLTEGATQTVEFFVPDRHDPAAASPRVLRASHIFTTPSSRFTKRLADIGTAGACNVDVPCSSLSSNGAFQDVVDSVAQLVFTKGSFTTLCTGSLLADANTATQVPWLYSANHCFDNSSAPYKTPAEMQQVANTLTTLWHFEANGCGSGSPSGAWTQVSGGATLTYNNVQTDVLLVRLNNAPPAGAFFSGWDANPLNAGAGVIAIHHPQGDLKKVSQGTTQGFSMPGVGGGSESFIDVRWSSGTTEPGSSGGGLWTSSNGQYLFRGGLWGGAALCTNLSGIDSFSRFDRAYPQIAAYLGSTGPATDYSDLWWNPNESGWGLNITQHPSSTIFAVWYTYEADGTSTWYVMPGGTWTSSNTYSGSLYATLGPAFTKTFNASDVQPRQVGTATLTFTSSGTGTFAYSVDGVSGTKSIQRQPF
jgi:hypothetical protein